MILEPPTRSEVFLLGLLVTLYHLCYNKQINNPNELAMSLPPLTAAALPFAMFNQACFDLSSDARFELAQRLYAGKLTLREAVALGYTSVESVDDWVDFWHDKSVPCELRELLGLSPVEYVEFLKDSSVLAKLYSATPAPAARVFGEDDYIPGSYWGRDHWTTLAYIETVMTDLAGFQVGADPRMKSNRRNFRVMSQQCAKPKRASNQGCAMALVMEPQHATKLNDGQQIPNHDDWACVQDMAAEGLFVQAPHEVEPRVILQFSEKGNKIANALREFRRGGGKMADFRWPDLTPEGAAGAPANVVS
jgi:hypothetical protein